MSVRKPRLLDSWALLAYLRGEPEAGEVRQLLQRARAGKDEVLMSIINLGEVYYQLHREFGESYAQQKLDEIRTLPLTIAAASDDLVIAAARVKARNAMSFADCFAVATALEHNAVVVTGDPEFKSVENVVKVQWLQ
ncbi:MAG: VapC toxin family PIN domain ribonuclease [Armatimonadetes bacterium CG_4_10_14_3_um_filter_66_18]|nr:MAG: hypothetical protein AUJ96_28630 [Armatimonadetes bacterium CG2_30_66_41]PIX39080.1 MAG: VapC toxin family PIN domain ribonuclease [Armatimonadetes bacterium CG_4_8_14_3_um_filter_66_20]PIY53203.1 MAG: VapC toxin family PIN domain ribonuclease [Armatimonadetes bacterium CG_4_10_14_3_um_filter_66_18]PIZ50306.1 MAG: VapC toxin family PIN domain ribonuclease [Armatimonadetes bacterium CG_4_10_14_0_8_um_filter_66_14]PJB65966.1 MAG: VapC toxin family PIN domain ribonuclease [Armatimonadetes 